MLQVFDPVIAESEQACKQQCRSLVVAYQFVARVEERLDQAEVKEGLEQVQAQEGQDEERQVKVVVDY
ncbi:unnamed protein product [Anisakis simplex]|uniref:V-type proton ATPase subunit a n=1 Tax=Anisakis simplex TaxID=6269 RepID=A0A0M3JMH9_ANISI|nr:unnamed protein product [Anisakis simplex]